jgi:hypothetical protein
MYKALKLKSLDDKQLIKQVFPYFCGSKLQPWLLNFQERLTCIGTN